MRELTGHSIYSFEGHDYDSTFAELMEFIEDEGGFLDIRYNAEVVEAGDETLHSFRVVI